MDTKNYFGVGETQFLITQAINILETEGIRASLSGNTMVRDFLTSSLRFIKNKPHEFDSNCHFNKIHIGERFFSSLHSLISVNEGGKREVIYELTVMCYRFLAEYDFMLEGQDEILDRILALGDSLSDAADGISPTISRQLHYASYRMPVDILKHLKGNGALKYLPEFRENVSKIPEYQESITKFIEEKEFNIKKISDSLEKYKTAFNFVGLYNAFNSMADKKRWSVRIGVTLLTVLAAFMIGPAGYKAYTMFSSGDYLASNYSFNIPFLISFGAYELLLVYFYRVILHNLKSNQAQLLQLDLRRALCQFIQSYADYAKELRVKDKDLLERFETLVFSGIVSETGDIPSSFDGIDQLAKLIQKARGT